MHDLSKSGFKSGHWCHLYWLHNSGQLKLSVLNCKLGIIIQTYCNVLWEGKKRQYIGKHLLPFNGYINTCIETAQFFFALQTSLLKISLHIPQT